jgi:AraC family ethanolamine operon transcriptional activator
VTLLSDDFDEVASTFARWDHRFEQLDAGRFSGRVAFVDLGGVQLFDLELNRRIAVRGSIPRESVLVSPILESNVGAIWRGRAHRLGTLNIQDRPDIMDHRTSPGYRNASLVVDVHRLHRAAKRLGFEDALPLLLGRQGLRIDPRGCNALFGQVVGILDALSNASPVAPPTPDPSQVGDRVLRCLLSFASGGRDPGPPTLGWNRRARLVRQAEDYMRAYMHRRIRLAEICDEFDVSERTLIYAFREINGLTPKAYLKTLRLNRFRHDLKGVDPRGETVRMVATRLGFVHLGELAADYGRLFGEPPSQTLRNRHAPRSRHPTS